MEPALFFCQFTRWTSHKDWQSRTRRGGLADVAKQPVFSSAALVAMKITSGLRHFRHGE
jgi:hypothetical protein